MSLIATVTVGKDDSDIESFLIDEMDIQTLESVHPSEVPNKTKIFLNGKWIGVNEDP